ncbi:MAG: hypothetical protein FD180_1793 [Planctomycetota bacterium]|nr:MAG: hypothetical protein FD180_1793 [Planctomycetota bacterium]
MMKNGIARAGLVTGLALFICGSPVDADPRGKIREAIARGDVKGASRNLAAEANRLRITGQPPTLAAVVDIQDLYLQIGETSGVTLVRMMLEREADEEYIKARGVPTRAAFEKVLALDAKHHAARRAIATMDAEGGNWPAARAAFEDLLAEDAANADTRHRYAFALCGANELDAALDQWARALEENPKHAASWYGCGAFWLNRGQFESAEKALINAVAFDPLHWGARESLIQALVGQGRFADAKILRDKLRELAPKLPRIGDQILVAVLPRAGGAAKVREALLDAVPWIFRIEVIDKTGPGRGFARVEELRRDGEAFAWGDVSENGEFRAAKSLAALPDLEQVVARAR